MTDYCTLAEVKTALRIPLADTTDDAEIAIKITAASKRIDQDTGRKHGFGLDSVVSTRIYRPRHEELLSVDDIATTTGLIVAIGKGSTFSTIDSSLYDFLPENASSDGLAIEVLRRLVGAWPVWGLQKIQVTAKWGWPAVPPDIHNAAILLSARLQRRKDSPEGLRGFNDLGVVRVSRYDSDYDSLIGPYIRDVK